MEFRTQIIIFCVCVAVGSFLVIASSHVAAQSNTQGVGISITIEGTTPTPTPPPPSGGGVGGSITPTPQPTYANLIIRGQAYPGAVVTISRAGAVAKTLIADGSGGFAAEVSALPSGS